MKKRKTIPEAGYLTQMDDPENVVEFRDMQACFFTDAGVVRAADGVTFDIPRGAVVGVVGESGCGKSVTSLSLMRLLQRPQGRITGGQIRLNLGQKAYDIAKMPEEAMIPLRGKELAMIFQEPMTALNPVFPVGRQVEEMLLLHSPQAPARGRVLELLEMVGIADPERVYGRYPHELSGGMRQRVMIAMAIACQPKVLIADEPTTALDVTIQAQILEILKDLKDKTGCSVLLITHDLGVVAGMADFVVVMYAGRVVERGTVEEIFYKPAHPYTLADGFQAGGREKDRPALFHPRQSAGSGAIAKALLF